MEIAKQKYVQNGIPILGQRITTWEIHFVHENDQEKTQEGIMMAIWGNHLQHLATTCHFWKNQNYMNIH